MRLVNSGLVEEMAPATDLEAEVFKGLKKRGEKEEEKKKKEGGMTFTPSPPRASPPARGRGRGRAKRSWSSQQMSSPSASSASSGIIGSSAAEAKKRAGEIVEQMAVSFSDTEFWVELDSEEGWKAVLDWIYDVKGEEMPDHPHPSLSDELRKTMRCESLFNAEHRLALLCSGPDGKYIWLPAQEGMTVPDIAVTLAVSGNTVI